MVVCDILAYEMNDPRIMAPVFLPVSPCFFCPFLCERDITYGRIHPYINDKVIMAREPDTPFEISRDTPIFQFLCPFFCIINGIGCAPECFDIIRKETSKRRQLEKEILLLTVLCGIPAYPAFCVLDLTGFKMFSTSLVAFVAPCRLPAVRTYPLNIPVRKESLIMRAVCKSYNLRIHISPVYQRFHNAVCSCMVCG